MLDRVEKDVSSGKHLKNPFLNTFTDLVLVWFLVYDYFRRRADFLNLTKYWMMTITSQVKPHLSVLLIA